MASAIPLSKADNFEISLGCLIRPALDELATKLKSVVELPVYERDIVLSAAEETLFATLHAKASRVLLLELNAARVTGRLTGDDSKERWNQFLELSSHRSFWDDLRVHYPPLLERVDAIVRNRCAAMLSFAERWAADRHLLKPLLGADPGELREVRFGAGDSHHNGQTVAIVRSDTGRIVYKPRSLAIDIALRHFISELAEAYHKPLLIRVPKAVELDQHGWVEFIAHDYASVPDELRDFYEGIGHWLAIMRLLGGNDFHAENLVAHGRTPVIVDCETLFVPKIRPSASGYGQAMDRAIEIIDSTVLSTGLLPGRGPVLGWRGIDNSAVGMLPGEQPMILRPTIVDAGSDKARIGSAPVAATVSQNHPSPQPALRQYWPNVLRGFDEMTETLRKLDARGALRGHLEPFADCHIRLVPRSTDAYAEIGRMLWHPVSLHKPEPAHQRAFDLLQRMAANVSVAPSDPSVINGEIDNLLVGDVPFFSALVRDGRMKGPGSTYWLPQQNLIDSALQNWRAANFPLERNAIHASLVSAYANERWIPDDASLLSARIREGDLDRRRRRQAKEIVHGIVESAIHGDDGTVAWIAPTFDETGWSVRPLAQDLYNGISGIALLMAAYLRETRAGRADRVDGVQDIYEAALHTLHLARIKFDQIRKEGVKVRPRPPGGYIGIASQIWTYLVLGHWGFDGEQGLERATALATEAIPDAVDTDETCDVLGGTAGAIMPLLVLARKTGQERYLDMASQFGDRVCKRAQRNGARACWPHPNSPQGIGGFAHGVTGIGWALAKLAAETGDELHRDTAEAAFSFEDALFDETEQNWLDLRGLESTKTSAAWCHGSVGIGLARLDADPSLEKPSTRQIIRRAAAATRRLGLGWNHCLCHGDFGAWELLDRAIALGEGPDDLTKERLMGLLLTSLEDHGPSCGQPSNAFAPGLMPGLGGVAYQLLRMDRNSNLPSVLIMGEGGGL